MKHPHPDKQHIVKTYRRFILDYKRRFGTARSLVHYKEMIQTYLTVKRELVK